MKRLPYINIFFFIAYIIFLVSCSNEKLPSINIIKKGLIGWMIKEPCNIIYSDAEKVDELSGKIKCRGGISSKYYKQELDLMLEFVKIRIYQLDEYFNSL